MNCNRQPQVSSKPKFLNNIHCHSECLFSTSFFFSWRWDCLKKKSYICGASTIWQTWARAIWLLLTTHKRAQLLLLPSFHCFYNRRSWDTENLSHFPRSPWLHGQALIKTQVWGLWNACSFDCHSLPKSQGLLYQIAQLKWDLGHRFWLPASCLSHWRACSALSVKDASRQWFRRWNGKFIWGGGVGGKRTIWRKTSIAICENRCCAPQPLPRCGYFPGCTQGAIICST